MRKSSPVSVKVRKLLLKNPNATAAQISEATGAGRQYIYNLRAQQKKKKVVITKAEAEVANKMGISTKDYAEQKIKLSKGRKRVAKPHDIIKEHYGAIKKARVDASIAALKEPLAEQFKNATHAVDIDKNVPKIDNVNHPAHYKVGGIETIDFIEAKNLGYNLGNVVKYITRADHKGNKNEDLLKARWYLNREIAKLNKK
jgi:hypothetical protein